jgi:arginine/lysine/ornithine decarboxylase
MKGVNDKYSLRKNGRNKQETKVSRNNNIITPIMMTRQEIDSLVKTLQDSYNNLKSIAAMAAIRKEKRKKVYAENLAAQFQHLIGLLQQMQKQRQEELAIYANKARTLT